MAEEKINPIRLTSEDGTVYTLEFSARTVKEAEGAGLRIGELMAIPMTMIPLLFFYSFKMHHPTIKRSTTDAIINGWGGVLNIPEEVQARLIDLYAAPFEQAAGDSPNVKVTVEL